jgi:hypothetical protein
MALILDVGLGVNDRVVVGPCGADRSQVVEGRRDRIPTGLINWHTDGGEPVQVRPDQSAAARIGGQEVDAFRSVPPSPGERVRRGGRAGSAPIHHRHRRPGLRDGQIRDTAAASARPLQHSSPASTSHGQRLCCSAQPSRTRGAVNKVEDLRSEETLSARPALTAPLRRRQASRSSIS